MICPQLGTHDLMSFPLKQAYPMIRTPTQVIPTRSKASFTESRLTPKTALASALMMDGMGVEQGVAEVTSALCGSRPVVRNLLPPPRLDLNQNRDRLG